MDPAWKLFLLGAVGFIAVAQALSGCLLPPQAAVPVGHRSTGSGDFVMPHTCRKVADGLQGFRSHPAGALFALTLANLMTTP